MIDTYIKLLNLKENIIKAMPGIKRAFVAFYGEDQEDFINEKLDNICLICYDLMDSLNSILYHAQNGIREEVINDFLSSFNDKKKAEQVFLGNGDLEFLVRVPFNDYIKYRNNLLSGKGNLSKSDALKFLKQINSLVTEDNMDYLIKKNSFSEIDKLIPKFQEMVKAYQERIGEYQLFFEINSSWKSKKSEIKLKYYHQLINEFARFFPKKMVQEVKNNPFFNQDNMLTAYLGKYVAETSFLDAFSIESSEIIENGGWRCDSLKKDRIRFFKALGYDLGDNYDDYINNSKIKKIIPSQQIINEIREAKKRLHDKMIGEYYTESLEYQENIDIIKKVPFFIRNAFFSSNYYINNFTCIVPNVINNKGLLLCVPLVFINCSVQGNFSLYFDEKIIHELNHVLEINLLKADGDGIDFLGGWDSICFKSPRKIGKSLKNIEIENRKYELFNEIINELIAEEITELMHSSGDYIINNPLYSQIKGGTSYEEMSFLAEEFYIRYKSEIILSRRNGNINIIFDKVGKENFDELNELFNIFNYNLSSRFKSLIESLQKGEETEDTRLFRELENRRDAILEKMKEYGKRKS